MPLITIKQTLWVNIPRAVRSSADADNVTVRTTRPSPNRNTVLPSVTWNVNRDTDPATTLT